MRRRNSYPSGDSIGHGARPYVEAGIGHVRKVEEAEANDSDKVIVAPTADQIRDEIDRLDTEIAADQLAIQEKRLARDALVQELIDMNQAWDRTQYPLADAESGE